MNSDCGSDDVVAAEQGVAGVVPIVFLDVEVLAEMIVDGVEHRRRRDLGAGALVSYEMLTRLWELPTGGTIGPDALRDSQLSELLAVAPGAVQQSERGWRRSHVPPGRVRAVFAESGSGSERIYAAAQFSRFCERYAVDVADTELSPRWRAYARRWEVGLANSPDGAVQRASGPPRTRRPAVWDWLLAEVAYAAWLNQFDQAAT